jgi:3-keto-5-aminohexanoate cleavage enzyme
MRKTIITCAVTGAETTRKQNPNLPITPLEIAQAAAEACEAGASILHLHVRDEKGAPTQNIEVFKETIGLIKKYSDIVIEVTTGGAVGMSLEERMGPLSLFPEMASLDMGTINFGDEFIENTLPMIRACAFRMKEKGVKPTLECFDLSHIDSAVRLIEKGFIKGPFHFGLVMGCPGGISYDKGVLEFFVKRLPPGSMWTAIGIGGRTSSKIIFDAVSLGGFIRVGFEDNIFYKKGELAKSNAQLVKRAFDLVRAKGCTVAGPDDVRKIFGLCKKGEQRKCQ